MSAGFMAKTKFAPRASMTVRLEIRLPAAAKELLQRAASSQHKPLNAFVMDSGLAAAAEVLAERREFKLRAQQYDAFVAALDAPSRLYGDRKSVV